MDKYFKNGAYILIVLSVLASCLTGARRIQMENDNKALQVAVRYTDIIDIAQQKDEPIEKILQELKDQGATTVLVRENTLLPNTSNDLANWKAQGKLTAYEGYELIKMYQEINNIKDQVKAQLNYIWVTEEDVRSEIVAHIKGQDLGGKEIVIGKDKYIEYRGTMNTASTVGMGFPLEDLTLAANLGFIISPQAKQWAGANDDYGDVFIDSLNKIPHLGPVYFADPVIAGFKSGQKAGLDPKVIEFAKDHQIGFIEFFSARQKGLSTLAKKTSEGGEHYKVVRLHTATDGEVNKLTSPEMISRYWLAATERNHQVLLFKKANTQNIDDDFTRLKDEIGEFTAGAERRGYKIATFTENYNLPVGSFVFAFLSGLGAIAALMLFLDLIGFRKVGIILGILGTIGYAGILKMRPTLGLQLMALFGASIFPAYAVLWALQKETKTLKRSIALFLQTCLISFGGAITIVGLLSRTSFGLTMDLFAGVKLAHLIPILLVAVGYVYQTYGFSINFIKKIAQNKVTYLALVVMGAIGLVLMIYTSRTGNAGTASDLELAFRSGLDRVLGVRPRTKEFMIGYPLMLTLFYYQKQERYFPLLILAIIGQISLVNTYAHVHTPLLISLVRSAYGIVFGLVLGLIAMIIINQVIKVAKVWITQKE